MITIVTGTDTGVGKTVATAALAVRAAAKGTVAVVKPAQTGVGPNDPGDLDDVNRLTGITALFEGVRLRDPLAPTTAARREGVPLPSAEIHAKSVDGLAAAHDSVIVEGAGGLLVGLDADGGTLAHLAKHLTQPYTFVIVTRAGLGTLSHTGLTVEALRARGLPVEGLIIGSWPAEPELADRCNLEDLPATTGLPVLARIPAGAGDYDQETFTKAVPGWFA
ncbi:ATP-dependent dethiobiotin synthetase BioD [Kribbella sandramycini]|uniref:ATP-dependent dethiobiotin synthetase BioD n=1 Tax=Kribbella sandramycini TaxID=60450 RepID=A0A7Y4P1L8_9ACTN|nr:dethiobiotin synthase [Kribbella sandramycini]MBB6564541.1 dethiobiotin synthetase [Kribbella sandramycini]NOL42245.1 ATP-dependent dethiobiotin synthetase BioD [Kribbella sandramycini]